MTGEHDGQGIPGHRAPIGGDSLGSVIARVRARGPEPKLLDNPFVTGVDEAPQCCARFELAVVSNQQRAAIGCDRQGTDAGTLNSFFGELGEDRSAALATTSLGGGPTADTSATPQPHVLRTPSSATTGCRPVRVLTRVLDPVGQSGLLGVWARVQVPGALSSSLAQLRVSLPYGR